MRGMSLTKRRQAQQQGKRRGRGRDTNLIVCHHVDKPVHGFQGLGCGQTGVARGQGPSIDAGGMVPAQVVWRGEQAGQAGGRIEQQPTATSI